MHGRFSIAQVCLTNMTAPCPSAKSSFYPFKPTSLNWYPAAGEASNQCYVSKSSSTLPRQIAFASNGYDTFPEESSLRLAQRFGEPSTKACHSLMQGSIETLTLFETGSLPSLAPHPDPNLARNRILFPNRIMGKIKITIFSEKPVDFYPDNVLSMSDLLDGLSSDGLNV